MTTPRKQIGARQTRNQAKATGECGVGARVPRGPSADHASTNSPDTPNPLRAKNLTGADRDRIKGETLAVLDTTILEPDYPLGCLSLASRITGVPIPTIQQWRDNRQACNRDVIAICKDKKEEIALACEAVALKALAYLPNTLDFAQAHQLSTVAGTLIDKMLLLRGQPNNITAQVDMTNPEQRRAAMAQLRATGAERAGLTIVRVPADDGLQQAPSVQ